jgi:phospholipid/cholesterol/gamma-HCH transport system permease protein
MASSTLFGGWLARRLRGRLRAGWQIVHLAATIVALGAAPGTYRAPWLAPLAQQVVRAAWPLLAWFILLSAVVSLVLIRIVLVSATSLGLSQLALEMLVRVLVVELIPLAAAFAVALRVMAPAAGELALARRDGTLDAMRRGGGDPLRSTIAPRALAGLFAVLLLATASGVVALVLAYLSAHGFSPWAFDRFTRLVGQVFSPAVTLVFVLKTLGFAGAVALIPIGSALHDPEWRQSMFDDPHPLPHSGSVEPPIGAQTLGMVRMFIALLIIETLSLMGNYL